MPEPRVCWVGGRFFLHHSSAPLEIRKEHKDRLTWWTGKQASRASKVFLGVFTTPTTGLYRQQTGRGLGQTFR